MYMLKLKWWQPTCHLDWCYFTFYFTMHRLIFVPVLIVNMIFILWEDTYMFSTLQNVLCLFCRQLIFFSKSLFSNKSFRTIMQMPNSLYRQIRHDILSGLIWVQTVCKGYQQKTQGDKLLRATKISDIDNLLHVISFTQSSINMLQRTHYVPFN